MGERKWLAGVELGGTKCIAILAQGPDVVAERVTVATTVPDETLGALRSILERWAAAHDLAGLGIGSFGPLDREAGRIVRTPKPGWSGADLLAALALPGLPVGLDTDVNGAALAEGRWGAARGLASHAYVTIGTGVGVGVVVNGRTVAGLGHAEAGHMRVPRMAGDEWPGSCPYHGDCVEGLIAGPAIAAAAGRPGDQLTADDPTWARVAHALAMMLHNLALTAVPQRVLVGGGVAGGRPGLLGEARRLLVESLAGYASAQEIAADPDYLSPPALGADAGPLGAIALAMEAAEGA